MKNAFLRWWLLLWVVIIASGLVYFYDLFQVLWVNDATGISFGILFIFTITSGHIGFLTKPNKTPHYYKTERFKMNVNACWFSAEAMTTLGMIGTVIGFILMIGPSFASMDLNNQDAVTKVISNMAYGMSTALSTTLVGLICSLITKAQLINLEYGTK